MGTKFYREEAYRLLGNPDHNKLLDSDPTSEIEKKVEAAIQKMVRNGSIDSEIGPNLLQVDPKPGSFYFYPKFIRRATQADPSYPEMGLPLAKFIRKHLPILQSTVRLKSIFPDPPVVAFSRPTNLRDSLVRAKFQDKASVEANNVTRILVVHLARPNVRRALWLIQPNNFRAIKLRALSKLDSQLSLQKCHLSHLLQSVWNPVRRGI
ncbi:hypothetical protein HOLleu_21237 [Holothuria leucospilota]|uniref:Uncharacterized protein n=1 Tax=Holothuria leucospilota TaxID=206669 RepID=A0A9Q1BX10_HOLLE|nr:hypothetical protein HOLleu_21237 [Holothuria leucospilota]